MNVPEEIMGVLIKAAEEDNGGEYINPNFLVGITELLENYYGMENDDVDSYVADMWGR